MTQRNREQAGKLRLRQPYRVGGGTLLILRNSIFDRKREKVQRGLAEGADSREITQVHALDLNRNTFRQHISQLLLAGETLYRSLSQSTVRTNDDELKWNTLILMYQLNSI